MEGIEIFFIELESGSDGLVKNLTKEKLFEMLKDSYERGYDKGRSEMLMGVTTRVPYPNTTISNIVGTDRLL